MNPKIFSPALIGLLIFLNLNACSLTGGLGERSAPETYLLDPPRNPNAPVNDSAKKPKIIVSMPQPWPGYASVEIAYTQEPNRIEYFSHSEWADTPARMIAPLLMRALEDSGLFGAVVSPGKGVAAGLRLDTEIVKMQQEFGDSPSIGRIVLRIQLIDLASARVLGTRTFEASAPAPSDDPAGGVEAMNATLSSVFDQISDYCRKVLTERPAGMD